LDGQPEIEIQPFVAGVEEQNEVVVVNCAAARIDLTEGLTRKKTPRLRAESCVHS